MVGSQKSAKKTRHADIRQVNTIHILLGRREIIGGSKRRRGLAPWNTECLWSESTE